MSFFFNEVVASNFTSNLVGFNFLISNSLDSSNLLGSNYSACFNFAGLNSVSSTLVGFTLVGFTSLASDFNNKLLLAPLGLFYNTLPTFPTSPFFSLGPPGIQANASCFDHLVYVKPLLSYFKHLYFSCQLCFADNLLKFLRILEPNNLQSIFPQTFTYQSYNSHIDNSSLSLNQQGGIFFQFSLPKFRLSSFPFALYISRPSSLVPSSSDSHPLEPLHFNRSFYSQNVPSYVGFLGSLIPSSISDSASPVDDPVDAFVDNSIGSSSSSVGSLASNNVISISNLSNNDDGLSTCDIPSLHHFLNLRSRTASFFGFLDSFFLLDSPFLDSLPWLDLSPDGLLSSSHHSCSLLSNLNQLHQMSFCLGDERSSINNSLDKLLVSSSNALCDEHFLLPDLLFSSNTVFFPLHEEHFSSDKEHFLLAEEHFLANNRIFTSNTSFPVTLLASSSNHLLDEYFFVAYAFLTRSYFSNFNCFSSFSSFVGLVTFSSSATSSINCSLSNHMDIYHHLDISNSCPDVNFSLCKLQAHSHCTFESHHVSTAFIFFVYYCVFEGQSNSTFFHFGLPICAFQTQHFSQNAIPFLIFITHNRIFERLNFVTFFDFAYPIRVFEGQRDSTFFNFTRLNRVSKLQNALTFFNFFYNLTVFNQHDFIIFNNFFYNLTVTLSLFKLPNAFFLSAFSCKNFINLIFSPSFLSGFELPNLSILLFGASNLSHFSCKNKFDLFNLPSNLKFSSSQKQYNLLNPPSFFSHFSRPISSNLLFSPSFLSGFESLNLSILLFGASFLSGFEGLNHNDLLNLPFNLKFSFGQKESYLLNWSSFLSHFSSSNQVTLLFWPSTLSDLSRKNKSVLFNLASTLSISSHKNKRDLLHCSSFLSAFVGKNSVHFLNSPSLKALLQKHSSSFSGSTSKQISNNLNKKANNLRSHYRIKMSFESKVDSQFAISLAKDYLLEQFPNAILLAACHQNTNHTHIHVLLFAKDLNGKKLHFSNSNYKKLDIGWAKLYARVFGHHKLQQHIDKKAQSRNWKKDRVLGVERDKPYRVSISNRLDPSSW